jgi:alpha-1,6-mannosyltransferase
VSLALLPLAARGAVLFALMGVGLLLHQPGARSIGSQLHVNLFVAVLGVAVLVYFSAVRLVLRRPQGGRRALWLVLGVALAMRLVLITNPLLLSSDIYRYVWDGRVQAAGVNPYRYIPVDPALASLRDTAIYPNINRRTYARTIYPPAAQVVFAVVGRISQTVIAMKLAMFVFEVIAVVCLLRILSLARLPAERVLIYAWNPLVLWSFACDGHVDAIAVGLLAVALLCRAERRFGAAGAFLAGAVLAKFLPIVVAPAFLRGGTFWRPALAGLAVILVLYGLYISAGSHVLGFMPSYDREEGIDNGSGFWLLAGLAHLMPLPGDVSAIYLACVAAGLGLLALVILRRRAEGTAADVTQLCRDTAVLAGCTMAGLSPHYTWYFAWLALPAVVAPIPAVLWLSAAPVALYLDPDNSHFLWRSILYVPAAALTVAALWRRRHPLPQAIATPEGTRS